MVDLALLQSVSYIAGAIGVCVAAFYYVMNLRISQKNQELSLKNQTLTLEIRQTDSILRWASIVTTKQSIDAFTNFVFEQQFSTFEEWVEKYGHHNLEAYHSLITCGQIFNPFGVLYEKKLMDIETIEKVLTPLTITLVWRKMIPIIMAWRKLYNEPTFWMPLENLYEAVTLRNPGVVLKRYD